MALELKDVLEIIDYSGDLEKATAEEIQNHVHSVFVARKLAATDDEIVNAVTGKRMGSIETVINRIVKDLGIEFSDEEIKGKKIEDKLTLLAAKTADKVKALEESGSKNNDEKVNTATKRYQELEAKYKEEVELRVNTQKLLDETEKEKVNTIKTYKLNSTLERIKSEIPISEDAKKDKYKIKGFELEFSEKYELDLDENDNIVIKDKKTGLPVKNEKQTAHDTFENVYKRELMAADMLKLNTGGENKPLQPKTFTSQANTGNNETKDYVHPKAKQNEERLLSNA